MTEQGCDPTWDRIEFAASFTEDMCFLVDGSEEGNALIIKTYLDESGTHDGAPVTAVAAYFGDARRWKIFARKWCNALRDFGINEPFHMKDYAHFQGAFKGWTASKQVALGKRLFPLIPEHARFGVSVAVIHSDMKEVFQDYPHMQEGLGLPYSCCFQWLISLVIEQAQMPDPFWRLGCIHEDNQYKGDAIEAWDWVKGERDIAKRLGTLAFAPKEDCVPLQAADVLAWESQKRLAEPNRPERKSLTALRRGGRVTIQTMSKNWLHNNAPRLDALAAEFLRKRDAG